MRNSEGEGERGRGLVFPLSPGTAVLRWGGRAVVGVVVVVGEDGIRRAFKNGEAMYKNGEQRQ